MWKVYSVFLVTQIFICWAESSPTFKDTYDFIVGKLLLPKFYMWQWFILAAILLNSYCNKIFEKYVFVLKSGAEPPAVP